MISGFARLSVIPLIHYLEVIFLIQSREHEFTSSFFNIGIKQSFRLYLHAGSVLMLCVTAAYL